MPVATIANQDAGVDGDRQYANAHLIAAAPAMYEALERYVSADYGGNANDELHRTAQAALAAARGEVQS